MATNNFKPFATAANANVTAQADWESLPALLSGFTAGKASSAQVNKAIRQASFIAAALAQYTANKSGLDVLDDGDLNGFISKMGTAFGKDFQALDATLSALAGLATGANKLPYFTGNDTAAQTDLTSVGRDIIGKNTIADILTYLGLGEAAKSRVLQSGGDSVKDVMSQNAITYLLSLKAGVNGERVEAENFREALNLGNAALKNTGTGQGQLPDMSAFLSNQEVNGYQYLPGGLILQWGSTPCEDRRTTVSKFPIPFPNECLMVIVCGFQVAGTYQAYTVVNGEWNDQFSWNAFFAQSGNIPVLAAAGQVNARFLAIGR
ncbi:hypothetical protein [Escherichia coli]|uniref:gp53-like domain-containing protein n=1 Tax=Escherichia coli TaxID=562 RepID=UPI00351BF6B5